jgi:hypothetical protein
LPSRDSRAARKLSLFRIFAEYSRFHTFEERTNRSTAIPDALQPSLRNPAASDSLANGLPEQILRQAPFPDNVGDRSKN